MEKRGIIAIITLVLSILIFSSLASAAWTFAGTVQNSSFVAIANANVSVGSFAPPGTVTYVNSTLTADDGSFHLTVNNDSATTMWKVTVLARMNASNTYGPTGNVTQVGPILPGMPKFIMNSSMFNGSTFYLEPAATLNLSAAFSNNSRSDFNYILMDDALGDHLDMQVLTFVTGGDRKIYVPRNRTYSLMFMKSPDSLTAKMGVPDFSVEAPVPPLPFAINNLSAYVDSTYFVNIRYNMSYGDYSVYGYVFVAGNNTEDRMVNFTKATVRLSLSGRVPPQGVLSFGTINISSKNTTVSNIDFPEGAIGYYRLPVLGSSAGISHVIQFYGKNQTGCNETAGGNCYFGAIQNFTLTTINITRNITLYPLIGSYDAAEGTKLKKFYIYDGDSANNPYISDAMMEVKLKNSTTIGTLNFMVTQITNSYFGMFMPSHISAATVKMFTHKSAPTEKPVPLNSSAVNFSIKGVQMELPDPSGERVAMAADMVSFKILRYNDSCNTLLADFDSCKIGNDLNGNFNPLSLLMGGKINLLISVNGSNSMMLFVGVDKMASAPPTNSVIGNQSTQSNSTGSTLGEVWRIGTLAPPIYERVYVKIPYNSSVDETFGINITLNKLYDNDWAQTWDIGSYPGGTNIPSDYSDYNTSWFNRTNGGMPCINTSTTADCYANYTGNYIIVKLPHFSNSDTSLNGQRVVVTVAADSGTTTSSGGSSGASATSSAGERSAIWDKISPAIPGTMKLTDEKFEVRQVDITTTEEVQNAKLTVTRFTSKPSELPETPSPAYSYMKLSQTNIDESKISEAKVQFRVNRSWLKDNGYDKNKVRLLRYADSWKELPTTLADDSETSYVYYEATTPGFSYFAIAATKAPEATTQKIEEQTAEAPVSAPTDQLTPPAKSRRGIWYSVAGIAALAAIGIAIWAIIRKRKR